MTRTALAAGLMLAGALLILFAGPESGVDGVTVLGLLLAVAGLGVHLADPDPPR